MSSADPGIEKNISHFFNLLFPHRNGLPVDRLRTIARNIYLIACLESQDPDPLVRSDISFYVIHDTVIEHAADNLHCAVILLHGETITINLLTAYFDPRQEGAAQALEVIAEKKLWDIARGADLPLERDILKSWAISAQRHHTDDHGEFTDDCRQTHVHTNCDRPAPVTITDNFDGSFDITDYDACTKQTTGRPDRRLELIADSLTDVPPMVTPKVPIPRKNPYPRQDKYMFTSPPIKVDKPRRDIMVEQFQTVFACIKDMQMRGKGNPLDPTQISQLYRTGIIPDLEGQQGSNHKGNQNNSVVAADPFVRSNGVVHKFHRATHPSNIKSFSYFVRPPTPPPSTSPQGCPHDSTTKSIPTTTTVSEGEIDVHKSLEGGGGGQMDVDDPEQGEPGNSTEKSTTVGDVPEGEQNAEGYTDDELCASTAVEGVQEEEQAADEDMDDDLYTSTPPEGDADDDDYVP